MNFAKSRTDIILLQVSFNIVERLDTFKNLITIVQNMTTNVRPFISVTRPSFSISISSLSFSLKYSSSKIDL